MKKALYPIFCLLGFAGAWVTQKASPSRASLDATAPTKSAQIRSTASRAEFDPQAYAPREFEATWEQMKSASPRERTSFLREWSRADGEAALRAVIYSNLSFHYADNLDLTNQASFLQSALEDKSLGMRRQLVVQLLGRIPGELDSTYRWELLSRADQKTQHYILTSLTKDKANLSLAAFEKLESGQARKTARWDFVSRLLDAKEDKKLHTEISSQTDPEARQHLVEALASAKLSSPSRIREHLANLPPEIYHEAVAASTRNLPTHRPADRMLAFLSAYVEGGHWSAFEDLDYHKYHFPLTDPKAREWALTLPADEGADQAVRGIAGALFRESLSQGQSWLKELPEGWHRQQALQEFIEVAKARSKVEEANWAAQELAP
ncbi:hypothetical protein [Roseibacillus persicicus]|uniref:HEAT repeat domain-containing protein n=1 Tax=Roseibacillus persicicus TaxID=454148 RepID=A0A918WDC5_9BACT|nr:hypothetical protein [Roseibacillus persicicus]GHC40506.1 hypothetical protein GCM10007100_01230 [Roseibacillus persicicus]